MLTLAAYATVAIAGIIFGMVMLSFYRPIEGHLGMHVPKLHAGFYYRLGRGLWSLRADAGTIPGVGAGVSGNGQFMPEDDAKIERLMAQAARGEISYEDAERAMYDGKTLAEVMDEAFEQMTSPLPPGATLPGTPVGFISDRDPDDEH